MPPKPPVNLPREANASIDGLQQHAAGAIAFNSDKWSVACLTRIVLPQNPQPAPAGFTRLRYSGSSVNGTPNWVKNVNGVNAKSYYDSEVRALIDLINNFPNNLNQSYKLVMYSSDGPCKSCKAVIKEFLQYYGMSGCITYKKEAYNVKNNIWPNGTLYGYGDEDYDPNRKLYHKSV